MPYGILYKGERFAHGKYYTITEKSYIIHTFEGKTITFGQ